MNKALQYSLKILGKKDYTVHELRQKMQLHEFGLREINEAIKVLIAKDFVNDERYAANYLRNHTSRGKVRIKFELIKRGIESDLIEQVLFTTNSANQLEQALEVAKSWWQRKNKPGVDQYKLKQQLMAKLSRQGFEYDIIRQTLDELIK